jgi:hypothetical protein
MELQEPNENAVGYRSLKAFVFRLQTELRALGWELLKHPRFHWTSALRDSLEVEGKRGGAADLALISRILYFCENEVLGLVHRSFIRSGWIVRAKVFDGVIVEKGSSGAMKYRTLDECMRQAEEFCRIFYWNIKLIKKPMHGLQDNPIETIEDARRKFRSDTHGEIRYCDRPLTAEESDEKSFNHNENRSSAYVEPIEPTSNIIVLLAILFTFLFLRLTQPSHLNMHGLDD